MGYHITLERSSSQSPITLEEWREFVGMRPELAWEPGEDEEATMVVRDDFISAYLLDHPHGLLTFSNGTIWTKTPSPRLISYMVSIAPHFRATVTGDEGEVYATQADCPTEEDWARPSPRKTFLQRELTPGNILKLAILLVVVAVLVYKHVVMPK